MDLDQLSLSMFDVDCDGSSCGVPRELGIHVHQAEIEEPLACVTVRDGRRIRYTAVADASVRLDQFLKRE